MRSCHTGVVGTSLLVCDVSVVVVGLDGTDREQGVLIWESIYIYPSLTSGNLSWVGVVQSTTPGRDLPFLGSSSLRRVVTPKGRTSPLTHPCRATGQDSHWPSKGNLLCSGRGFDGSPQVRSYGLFIVIMLSRQCFLLFLLSCWKTLPFWGNTSFFSLHVSVIEIYLVS